MRAEKISDNNFGMKINNNMPLQMLQHFWQKKFTSQEIIGAFQKIKNAAPDTLELSFNEFLIGTPSEVIIRRALQGVEKFSVLFANIKKGRPKKGAEGRTVLALSPQTVAQIIVDKTAELIKNLKNPHSIKSGMNIIRNNAFERLQEYWKKRASVAEIRDALNKISSSADSSYCLRFKSFVHENPREIFVSKGAEQPYLIKLPIVKRVVMRGRKPKVPREALSPMQTAEIISAKIKEYVQNGFIVPRKKTTRR